MAFKVLDLFSGIGGFSLGLERAGMKTIAFCENDKHARAVLKKHWPLVPIHHDIRELNAKKYRRTADIVCGGFPCQDLSVAGKKTGFEGSRSSLYREMLRVVSECEPRYAIFENVTGLLTGEKGRWFAQFLYDLAKIGYDAEWHCISASYVGHVHHRDRIWIIAYPKYIRWPASEIRQGLSKRTNRYSPRQIPTGKPSRLFSSRVFPPNTSNQRLQKRKSQSTPQQLDLSVELKRSIEGIRGVFDLCEPPLCRTNDGVSGRIHRLKQLGNAVVPQIPEAIGRAIIAADSKTNQ